MVQITWPSMRLAKLLFPVSLLVNFILLSALFSYILYTPESFNKRKTAEKYPVLLIQKNQSGVEALNLSSNEIKIQDEIIPPSKVEDNKVITSSLTKIPENGSFTFENKTYEFPSEYAKRSPDIVAFEEVPQCSICIKKNDRWIIPKGQHRVDNIIVIPSGLTFEVSPGANIEFLNNGGIFSRSPLHAENVTFSGNDWKGVVILSHAKSVVKNVTVVGGKGFDFLGMRYTGVINFIRGEQNISDLTIRNTLAEDGINLKWVKATINNLSITDAGSDAIDIDWSDINLSNVNIKNAKNDCTDFSGGKITASHLILENCQDKAISNGERNDLHIDDASVSKSKTGIANKDGSKITVGKLSVMNSERFFHQYHQKAFYSEPEAVFENRPEVISTGKSLTEAGKVGGHAAF